MSIFSRGLITSIRVYQCILSPDHSFWAKALQKPPYCKHFPTCSDYGIEAIERHGAGKGSWMAAKRIARCNPWSKGGYDPVQPNSTKNVEKNIE